MTIEGEIAELRSAIARLESKIDNLSVPVAAASYNLKDAAVVLGVGVPIVRRLITEGHLIASCYPGMTDRRIPRTSIDAFLVASLITDRSEVDR